MRKIHSALAVTALVLALLACNAVTGGGKSSPPSAGSGGSDSGGTPTGGSSSGYNTQFPLPDAVSNFTDMGNGTINFQTTMSLDAAMKFYEDAFAQKGYTERTALTSTSSSTFSIVFDGDPSGQSVVVQGVDLGNGTTNVSIRLETIQ